MTITVVNVKRDRPSGMTYIGRRCAGFQASPLGNPHKLGVCPCGRTHEADEALILYRQWLRDEWRKNGAVRRELERLAEASLRGDVVLGCWCKPHPCHGDVVKDAIEGIIRSKSRG